MMRSQRRGAAMPRKPAAKKAKAKPAKKPAAVKPAKKAAKKPAASRRARRLEHHRKAADALERHSGPVLNLLAEVINDLAPEIDDQGIAAQDFALIAELSHRLDRAIELKDPLLEGLSDVIILFVSAAAVGIYRLIEGRNARHSQRLARLKERLTTKGPAMGAHQRQRLERRIARLEG